MLTNLTPKKFKNIFIFLLITLSLINLSVSDGSTCTEQWTEINTSLENWLQKGDLEIKESSDGKPIFTFGPKNISAEDTNYLGESWLKVDLSKNRGMIVTFKPELYAYGNSISSYPEGFAVVFTSSEPEKFNLGQNEGLGYEGIINGIALEFDFIKNAEKGDSDKPHLSVNYNISGILSAASIGRTDNLYNIELPNFYDKLKENYDANIYFEIKIFSKKLTVIAKSSTDKVLLETDFLQFQQLLENGDCSMGLTSTGNGDSGVTIKDLKVEEISMDRKGYLVLENAENDNNGVPNVKAGKVITLDFYVQSLCGEKLRIYLNEINQDDFKFQVNEENLRPESISFDEDSSQIKIVLTLNVAKMYTAIVEFHGYDSYPLQFIVKPNDVSRLELCEHGTTDTDKYYSTSILDQTKEYFYVPLCIYDNLGNLKDSDKNAVQNAKIKYPLNMLPDETIELEEDKTNQRVLLKIFFSAFGTYEIFAENFINEKIRYVKLMPQYISPDKSLLSILYGQNVIQSSTEKINLRIKLKDNFNRDIPVVTLKAINCDFSESKVTLNSGSSTTSLSVTSEYKDDYVVLSMNKPSSQGNYIFIPKVKCTNIDSIQLTCGLDSLTQNNNCEFFYPTETINTNYIKVFDEISEEYIIYQKDTTSTDYLYISLEEKDNNKLTDIILLDAQESNYLSNSPQTITASLDSVALTVTQIGNKYSLILPSDKTRLNYTPVKLYVLQIILNGNTFNIKLKFYFMDKYMTNVDISQTDSSNITYIAFYKQNSFTLEAQETLLLFEIYELSEGKYLGNINTLLDASKVTVEINNAASTGCEAVNHNNFFLWVICHAFTKTGEYSISLKYDGTEIINKAITIISKGEVYALGNENGTPLADSATIEIGRENLVKLVMLDKYDNVINDNRIFNAFSKIKISDNDVFYIKQNYDGKVHIFNEGNIADKSVTLTLMNGKTYTIKSVYAPTFENNFDPVNSYGLLTNEAPIIESNDDITLSLYLRDKYGNYISGTIDKTNLYVYIEGKNMFEIVSMTSSQTSATEGKIDYTASLKKNGDYLIKIFFNNFPIECRGCHFRKNYIAIEDYSKTCLQILGNKQKYPIFNGYGLTSNLKVGIINKNNFFSFYLDQRDQNLNEIKKEGTDSTITLNFGTDISGVDTSSIKFCETEKGYYQLCDNVFSSWSQLTEGLYYITNEELKYKFYIYLSDSVYDTSSSTPKAANSFIYNHEQTLYGTLETPVNFIVDLRTSNYKRIKGLDKSKFSLYNRSGLKNVWFVAVEGPEEGLFNIFFYATVPNTYAFYLIFNGANIISTAFRFICSCGSDVILKPVDGSDFLYNGNYVFFNLINSNGNECTTIANWNPLNEKNFANYIFKAEKDGKNYKTETYYNHITNTLIVYLENYVTEQANFYTDVYKFPHGLDYLTFGLMENIIDENHFYASISGGVLSVKALNANYEPAFECSLEDTGFIVTLIRIVNDDFVILNNNYVIQENFCEFNFDIASDIGLMDAKGKYLYIVYYHGKEIFCQNCLIEKTENNIDMTKTKVFHKEGDYQYFQNDATMVLPLFKTNLPFFKVNIMSAKNNLVILDSGLTIELKTLKDDDTDDVTFSTGIKYTSNGNIYIYLNTDDRDKYWTIDSMKKMKLSITYGTSTFTANYFVMDNYVKRLRANENCDTTVAPMIINQQSLYIKRYDEDLELEVRLSNCLKLNLEIISTIEVYESDGSNKFDAELIPSDMIGSYYLFLPKTLAVNNSKKYYMLNKFNIKSDVFELSVMPGYDIGSIEFKKDENMDESGGDKIYTYFLVQMKDKYNNIITNVGRNLFVNDIFAFSVNNIPYRLSYDSNLKYFRCQVPIFTSAKLKVQSLISDKTFNVEIEAPKVYRKSLVTLDSEVNNLYTFTFKLKDDVYNDVTSEDYTSEVSFKYITINPLTEQVFLKEVSSSYLGQNKFTVQLDKSFPKYSYYGFIPYIQFFPQICPSCMTKNIYPDYIYLLKNNSMSNFEPHDINKNIYLIKDNEYPSFIYLSHGEVTIESSEVTVRALYTSENTILNLMSFNGGSESININITKAQENTKITFKAEFIDYSLTTSTATSPSYIGIFGDSIFSPNLGDSKYITFFIELRDGTNNLISTKPTLYTDDSFSNLIDSIYVMNTCFTGVYYIQVNLAKSGNIDFYLKFSESQTKTTNDEIIYINSKPSFPNYISLENKEVVNKNNIKFIFFTHNAQNEAVCDERLNIYMEDMNLKGSHITLDYYENQCELYLIFGGYAKIRSNINNYITEVNNNDKSLYNISPQFSKMSIKPNIFSSEEETLTVKFTEKSPSKNTYGSTEFNGNKTMLIYKYITPNKFQLINSVTNLLSNEYTFNPKNLGIVDREIHILIGTVVDSTISPIFAYYQPEQASSSDIKGIEAIYFNDEQKFNVLTNFALNKVYTGETLGLTLPLLLRLKFLDEKGNDLDVSSENGKKYTAKLILANDSGEKFNIDLILRQFNDKYFYIQHDPTTIEKIIHLPVYLTDTSLKYFIKVTYDSTINLFSLLSLENRNHIQSPSVKKRYSYPGEITSVTPFKILTASYETTISIPKGKSNINNICFYQTLNDEDIILNQHLDLTKITLTIDSCTNKNIANSYMGCFDLYINCVNAGNTLSVSYESTSATTQIAVNLFDNSAISFTLDQSQSSSSIEYNGDSTSTGNLYFTSGISSLSIELFSTFINGEKIENVGLSNGAAANVLNFIIPKIYFDTIPKTKKVMVLYDDGSYTQTLLSSTEYSISVTQKEYINTLIDDYYSFKIQDPLNLKVGQNILFYLLIYDKNNACYYGDFSKLSNIEITIKNGDLTYTKKIKSQVQIEGYSQCEYIYSVDFDQNARVAGNYDLTVKDGEKQYESKIYIAPGEIDETKSKIESEETEVQAGHNIYLTFSGTDSEGNVIDYYDLINNIDITLVDSEGNDVEKIDANYFYDIRVNSDNSAIEIYLKINNYGSYSLKIIKNGIIMNLPNEFRVTVQPLECSMFEPELALQPIDGREEDFYYKEKITIEIKCKDIFGNHVSERGKEIFKAYTIRAVDNQVTEFNEYFEDGVHYIPFSTDQGGNYTVDVTLNGKKYGNSFYLIIKSLDGSNYVCMDKTEVESLADCDSSAYRAFLIGILGEAYVCSPPPTPGALFKCAPDDAECVINTNNCDCQGNPWQGFCYPENVNPISQVTNSLVTCISKISNAVSCGDGSCRFNQEECLTDFECPLGFKSCANKCILINKNCDVNIECNTGEVLCWDLTCAEGYDSCPTRITCPLNKVLCPDGTCQESGHCVQPPNRECEEGEYQCADFSCVSNRDDCPKNLVCDPGYSLCENKTCNEYCKEEVIVVESEDDDNNNAALIGGLVGGIGGAAILGLGAFYLFYWRKRKMIKSDDIDFNTAEQNLNPTKNKETVSVYKDKKVNTKENINQNAHPDIDEIGEAKNPIKESTDAFRKIKNSKK